MKYSNILLLALLLFSNNSFTMQELDNIFVNKRGYDNNKIHKQFINTSKKLTDITQKNDTTLLRKKRTIISKQTQDNNSDNKTCNNVQENLYNTLNNNNVLMNKCSNKNGTLDTKEEHLLISLAEENDNMIEPLCKIKDNNKKSVQQKSNNNVINETKNVNEEANITNTNNVVLTNDDASNSSSLKTGKHAQYNLPIVNNNSVLANTVKNNNDINTNNDSFKEDLDFLNSVDESQIEQPGEDEIFDAEFVKADNVNINNSQYYDNGQCMQNAKSEPKPTVIL